MSSERLEDLANDLIAYILNLTDDVDGLSHYLHGIGYTDNELEGLDLGDGRDA